MHILSIYIYFRGSIPKDPWFRVSMGGVFAQGLLTNQPSPNEHNVIGVRWPKLLFGQHFP